MLIDDGIYVFDGEHRWLSNFWPARIPFQSIEFPSVEHAYVYSKLGMTPELADKILSLTPGQVKRYGRDLPISYGWDGRKIQVMFELIKLKFSDLNPELRDKLIATGDKHLEEGNNWGDTFWGVCRGAGKNHLGELLMQHRYRLQTQG